MNQWMFNGVWRVRVTGFAFHPAGDAINGWDVTMQWGNGTSMGDVTPGDTRKNDLVLALANGDTMAALDTNRGRFSEGQLDTHTFPASGQFTYTQTFFSGNTLDQNNKPTKLLVTFDKAGYNQTIRGKKAPYTTSTPNYRIDLTCTR